MDVEAWQIVVALSVPVFGLLGSLAGRERMPGLYRRLKHSTSAMKDLPTEASIARAALEVVVVRQAEAIAASEAETIGRRLNRINVALSVIATLFLLLGAWLLLGWTAGEWGEPWAWVAVVVTVAYLLVAMVFSAAAFGTVYNPPAPKRSPKPKG